MASRRMKAFGLAVGFITMFAFYHNWLGVALFAIVSLIILVCVKDEAPKGSQRDPDGRRKD